MVFSMVRADSLKVHGLLSVLETEARQLAPDLAALVAAQERWLSAWANRPL